jgi:hypothetical protein
MLHTRANRWKHRIGSVEQNVIFALLAVGALVGGLTIWRIASTTQVVVKEEKAKINASQAEPDQEEQLPKDWVKMGGVARPSTDVRSDRAQSPKEPLLKREGGYPKVALDANPQVAQVAEALKSGKNPERYSSLIVPKNFDADAFAKDPEKYAKEYASIVEPGRVFAPAQPGDSVPVLRVDGDRHHRVTQGESVRLVAVATPFAPVSFTSTGLGQFENLLTTITVVADQTGKAVAPFTATSGTKHNVKILAASPVMAEQIKFTVSVELPPNIVAQNTARKSEAVQ